MDDLDDDEDEYDDFPTLEEESSGESTVLNYPPLISLGNGDGYVEISMVESGQHDNVTVDGVGLQGMWTGYTVNNRGYDAAGLAQIHIEGVDGDKFRGVGMNKFGIFHIEGRITSTKGTQHNITFNFKSYGAEFTKDAEEGGGDGGENHEVDGKENEEEQEEGESDEEKNDGEESNEGENDEESNEGESDEGASEEGEDDERENGEDEAGSEGGTQADTESESDTSEENEDNVSGVYKGIFDTATLTISGIWINEAGNKAGTFNLSKRPAFACQFKYTEEQFRENPARARWMYALSAIRQQVQTRLWSWNYLKARADTRKRYIELRLRKEDENSRDVHPDMELTEQEEEELDGIERGLLPQDARYYLSLVNEASEQRCIHHGYSCDGCDAALIGARMICLVCVAPNFLDNMDFCDLCFDVTKSDRGFDHYPEHDSLVLFKVLPRRAKRELINRAREFAEEGRASVDNNDGDVLCASCSTPVALPCWLCYDCDNETFICADCQKKFNPTYIDNSHTSSHTLIRLSDTSALGRTLEITVKSLDERLSKDIAAVHNRMDKLEETIKGYESGINEMIKGYEAGVNQRINALEVLVQQRLSRVEELLLQILTGAPGQHSA
ncbi:hypothetical protein FRC18_005515 [Serendipita sp. 400]|nr:hypothetical protein FRC18_005515 [Serendipita sp. 400]